MKTLYLIRHAKSRWDETGVGDHDRGLNARGLQDCQTMSARFAEMEQLPELIFSSSAVRAKRFANALAGSTDVPLEILPELYTFSLRELASCVARLGDELTNVALVGHNPAMTGLVNQLGNHGIDNLPTAGIVQLTLDWQSWHDIEHMSGHTVRIITPKGKIDIEN